MLPVNATSTMITVVDEADGTVIATIVVETEVVDTGEIGALPLTIVVTAIITMVEEVHDTTIIEGVVETTSVEADAIDRLEDIEEALPEVIVGVLLAGIAGVLLGEVGITVDAVVLAVVHRPGTEMTEEVIGTMMIEEEVPLEGDMTNEKGNGTRIIEMVVAAAPAAGGMKITHADVRQTCTVAEMIVVIAASSFKINRALMRSGSLKINRALVRPA